MKLFRFTRRRHDEDEARCSFSLAASSKPAVVAEYRCVLFAGHPGVPHRDQHGNETSSDQPMFFTK